jgi:DNA primase
MPRYAEESIRRVAEANDIIEVIGAYVPLKRAGSAWKGLCPFHKEKTPSFTVNPARQSYHCFGCQAGGGVIRFVMDYEHLPFTDALVKLADRAGIRLIEETGAGNTGRDERPRLLELHRLAATFFNHQLFKSPSASVARDYLKERGLNQAIAQNWGLGYAPAAPDALAQHARAAGFHPTELVRAGLCYQNDRDQQLIDRFRDRVMIPICNDYGDVVAFSGRILDPASSPAKYINSPETPLFSKGRLLFGLHKTKRALIDTEEAIICEGQFDLISLYEAGVQNVLAPQGTAFTPHQATLLKRFVRRVTLCFDSDPAGQKAAERSLPALLTRELTVRILALPPGEDPDSLIRREGGDAFRQRVANAPGLFEHKLSQARSEGLLDSPAGLAAVTKDLAALLCLLPDPVLQDATRNQIAATLQIDPTRILTQMRQTKPAPPEIEDPGENPAPPTPPPPPPPRQ